MSYKSHLILDCFIKDERASNRVKYLACISPKIVLSGEIN